MRSFITNFMYCLVLFSHISMAAVKNYNWDVVLYENKDLKVTSNFDIPGDAWCAPDRIAVTVIAESSISHEKIFAQNYKAFVLKEIIPKIKEICPKFPYVEEGIVQQALSLQFVQKPKKIVRDSIYFVFHPDGSVTTKGLMSKRRAERKREIAVQKKRTESSCPNGVFCDLPGGKYLNAIYEGKSKLLSTYENELEYKGGSQVEQMIRRIGASPFILSLTSRYMYNYKHKPQRCFKLGATEITVSHKTEKLTEVNGYGNPTGVKFGGIEMQATYKINPEFKSLCSKLCTTNKGAVADIWVETNSRGKAAPILKGFDIIASKYDCNSSKVKQFERNLISMALERVK